MPRVSWRIYIRYIVYIVIVTLLLFARPIPGVHAASITVNDSCRLHDAITAANTNRTKGGCPAGSGADTITLTGNIVRFGENEGLNVTSDITILGNAYSIELRNARLRRAFRVSASGRLTIKNVVLLGGRYEPGWDKFGGGGAIHNAGYLEVSHSIFQRSVAFHGGAIYSSGTLIIKNSTFYGNAGAKQGGAIFADGGSVTISNSSFTQNHASYEGGAILAKVPLTITGTGFYGNYVDSILAEGGAIHQAFSHLTISNSSFGANRALEGSGGAIQMDYARGNSTISDSYFFSNQATSTLWRSWQGGAISIDNGGQLTANLTITGTRFTNNSAVEGGAIASNSLGLVIRNSSFKGNSAENGGAIYRGDDRPARIAVDIANSTFYQNRANRKGGAIAVLSIGFQTSTIRHSTFVDNHLRDGNGFTDDITENILTRSNVYNSVFLSTSGRSKLCGVNGAVRGNVSLTRFCSPSGNNYNVLAYPLLGAVVEPKLGPAYFPLLRNSPAIGAGDPAHCLPADQLGNLRPPVNTTCDSGAVEYVLPRSSQQQVIDENPTPAATGQMGRNTPGNLVSLVNSEGILLRWEPPNNGSDGYAVYRKYGDQTDYVVLGAVFPAGDFDGLSYFDDLNIRTGKYRYVVETIRLGSNEDEQRSEVFTVDVKESDMSTPTPTATFTPLPNDVVRNLRVSGTSYEGIVLEWDAPTTDVRGFEILRRRMEWAEREYRSIGRITANQGSQPATRYFDSGVTTAGEYMYAVKSLRQDETYTIPSDPLKLNVNNDDVATITPTRRQRPIRQQRPIRPRRLIRPRQQRHRITDRRICWRL